MVIAYNSAKDLPGCLAALEAAEPLNLVLVIDNASSDDSAAIARKFGVDVLTLDENLGFAGGCNAAFRHLGKNVEFVAFLNPDVQVEAECLACCARTLSEHPEAGCVAPLLLRPDGKTIDSAGQCLKPWTLEVEDRGYGRRLDEFSIAPGQVLAACGALAVFRRPALEAADEGRGPFAGHFFCFWEDLELGWRLNNLGWKILFEPEARAIHRRGAGAAEGRGPLRWRRPPHLEACILSNRWMTLIRHLSWRDLIWRIPVLLVWDLALLGAGILQRPELWRHLIRRWPMLRREWTQRKDRPRERLKQYPC